MQNADMQIYWKKPIRFSVKRTGRRNAIAGFIEVMRSGVSLMAITGPLVNGSLLA